MADFLFNSEYLINNRSDPATSHLIKLITETVLLAIIKASFSFNLSIEIWDQLMSLLSAVNSYSDVVDKWIVRGPFSLSHCTILVAVFNKQLLLLL